MPPELQSKAWEFAAQLDRRNGKVQHAHYHTPGQAETHVHETTTTTYTSPFGTQITVTRDGHPGDQHGHGMQMHGGAGGNAQQHHGGGGGHGGKPDVNDLSPKQRVFGGVQHDAPEWQAWIRELYKIGGPMNPQNILERYFTQNHLRVDLQAAMFVLRTANHFHKENAARCLMKHLACTAKQFHDEFVKMNDPSFLAIYSHNMASNCRCRF
jgi:hypothetical protein